MTLSGSRLHVVDLTTLFIDHGSGGGVNTYLAEKARYFSSRDDVQHSIVVPGARDETDELHGSTLHKVRSRRLPWNPEHRVLFRLREVARILREIEPTVVEVDCAYLLGRTAARALAGHAVPIIGFYHVHLPTFIARPGTAGLGSLVSGTVERLTWHYVRRCTRDLDRIVVSSPDIERRLDDRGFRGIARVPLGVNTDVFRPVATREAGGPRIAFVGRLSGEKDLDVLFDAFATLGEDARLDVVGDGPMRKKLERRADRRVCFHGAQPYGRSLAALYARADVLVNPSPNEAFGLANLEAAACGVPVVAARRGGPLDVVTPEIGLLAEPGDAQDFAAKIRDVLDHPERFAGARQAVEQRYSWSRCFERLLDVYRGALVERGVEIDRSQATGRLRSAL